MLILRSKIESSTVGLGIELIKNLKVNIPYRGIINVKLELPTLLSRSRENNNDILDLKMFLDRDNGSIAISQAICTTHHVNIALSAKQKKFTKTFLDSLMGLQEAANVLNCIVRGSMDYTWQIYMHLNKNPLIAYLSIHFANIDIIYTEGLFSRF